MERRQGHSGLGPSSDRKLKEAVVILPPLLPSNLNGKVPTRGLEPARKRRSAPMASSSCPPGLLARGGQSEQRSRSSDAPKSSSAVGSANAKAGAQRAGTAADAPNISAAEVCADAKAEVKRAATAAQEGRRALSTSSASSSVPRAPELADPRPPNPRHPRSARRSTSAATSRSSGPSDRGSAPCEAGGSLREERRLQASKGRAASQQRASRQPVQGQGQGQEQEQEETIAAERAAATKERETADRDLHSRTPNSKEFEKRTRKRAGEAADDVPHKENDERAEPLETPEQDENSSESPAASKTPDQDENGSESPAPATQSTRAAISRGGQGISTSFVEDFSWGRSFSDYIGSGYLPPGLEERLEPMDLIQKLFEIRKEMKSKLRYESGRITVRRPAKGRGMNKPVTYASNIWNRGYANCAGLCIVFVAALTRLGVPYCIVTARSCKEGLPKHAIVQVGFPETTDIKAINGRAKELWGEYYGRLSEVRRDPETQEPRWVKLFRGLKFTRSSQGSTAAQHKGAGRWLWLDPQVKVGYYLHLIEDGYLVQEGNRFSFAVTPEIKAWSSAGKVCEPVSSAEDETEELTEALTTTPNDEDEKT